MGQRGIGSIFMNRQLRRTRKGSQLPKYPTKMTRRKRSTKLHAIMTRSEIDARVKEIAHEKA